MGLLAVTGNAFTLKVRNVGRERGGTESTAPMADHTGLHDDAAMTRKEPATAERSAASPKCRVPVPRKPPTTGRIRAAIAGFPGRTQYLVDKALAAATIADASQSDIEIFIAAIHRCDHGGSFLGLVPE
jgi:hypothetical protein